jgi:hypothetical protein
VKLPAGNAVVPLANTPEVHEAVEARLVTTMTWLPGVLPEAAEAVTTAEFEDETVLADSEPVMLFRFCVSVSRLDKLVLSWLMAELWL